MADEMKSLIERLESATIRLEKFVGGAGSSGAAAATDTLAPSVVAYDAQVEPLVKEFCGMSAGIGGQVSEIAGMVREAFGIQREILIKASKCKQPEQSALLKIMGPLNDAVSKMNSFKDANRGSQYFNHLSMLCESVPALGWVAVSPTPAPFIKDMQEAGMFYSNRVLKEYKEKDEKHVAWVRAWGKVITELHGYVKQQHTTGLQWNAAGGDVGSSVPPPPAAGAPPPPPPGPPPPPEAGVDTPAEPSKTAALFADINKGADITKGLKKVSDDMKTHKNPSLRTGPQPFKPAPGPKPGPAVKKAFAPVAAAKPPVIELVGKKWAVEYQKGNGSIVIDDTNIKQSVYIYKCEKSTIQVKGKVNSIILDSCKKTALVFDDVISSVDAINCQSVQIQVNGTVNTLSVDKTDGYQVYLSEASKNAELITAKSSEMNVLVPDANGEFKESAVPEQFKTVWNGSKLVTTVMDIAA